MSKSKYELNPGQCVPCCKLCNVAKNTMSEDQFYNWIKKLFKFSVKQGRIND